jgi:hypothetical protein
MGMRSDGVANYLNMLANPAEWCFVIPRAGGMMQWRRSTGNRSTDFAPNGDLGLNGGKLYAGDVEATGVVSGATVTATGTLTAGQVVSMDKLTALGDASFYMGAVGAGFKGVNFAAGYALRYVVANGDIQWVRNSAIHTQLTAAGMGLMMGDAYKNVAGPWNANSDERIKERISDYTAGLDQIMALRPRWFGFRSQAKRGEPGALYIGLIAQEAKQAMPETVSTGPGVAGDIELEDMHTLDPGPVTWALVNAVKTLHATNEELSERIYALEKLAEGF